VCGWLQVWVPEVVEGGDGEGAEGAPAPTAEDKWNQRFMVIKVSAPHRLHPSCLQLHLYLCFRALLGSGGGAQYPVFTAHGLFSGICLRCVHV
jgi:hypothetical protein